MNVHQTLFKAEILLVYIYFNIHELHNVCLHTPIQWLLSEDVNNLRLPLFIIRHHHMMKIYGIATCYRLDRLGI
jgi:hypothetical protein